ncbi:hypothetical protein B0H21DRAFT_708357 [Amylocystis lapponica]|nr:hypothetical protein B0H21DRAFT_708357 [Amylocystis lapponica]
MSSFIPTGEQQGNQSKILVLCFDGTGVDRFSGKTTNVAKLFRALTKDRDQQQICYYQPGIGTILDPKSTGSRRMRVARLLDQAIAGAYEYLMDKYRAGDKICIFGKPLFQLPAFLGVLISPGFWPEWFTRQDTSLVADENCSCHKLNRDYFADRLYAEAESNAGSTKALDFKKGFCVSASVDFMGAWDTVSGVGILNFPSRLIVGRGFTTEYAEKAPSIAMSELAQCGNTDVREVWFSGCHSDVGGSTTGTQTSGSLSDISFRWMVDQIRKSNCGILLEDNELHKMGISNYNSHAPISSASPSLAHAPIRDQLKIRPLWWVLEVIPLRHTYQESDGRWVKRWSINRGRDRVLPVYPTLHATVRERIEGPPRQNPPLAKDVYKPKARYSNPQYVE